MDNSRIPKYERTNPDGMSSWFFEMAMRDLIFHPEESPRDIHAITTGERTFTDKECAELEFILSDMFEQHGDGVCEAAFKIVARSSRILAALDS